MSSLSSICVEANAMHGLPKDFNGSFLVGRFLEIVSYTSTSIYLGFDNEVTLTIESSFEYLASHDDGHVERQQVPVRTSSVMQLIGQFVESVNAGDGRTLALRFAGGSVLRCFDDQTSFESYRIANG